MFLLCFESSRPTKQWKAENVTRKRTRSRPWSSSLLPCLPLSNVARVAVTQFLHSHVPSVMVNFTEYTDRVIEEQWEKYVWCKGKMERRKSERGGKDTPRTPVVASADTCGVCFIWVRTNQNSSECQLCDSWFHIGYQCVSLNEYKIYKHEDCNAIWLCTPSNNKFKHLKKKENRLIKRKIQRSRRK